jgi:proline dehydrogenase
VIEHLVAHSLPLLPKALVERFARRYVAGETIADAMSAVDRINDEGGSATVDYLREDITELVRAEAVVSQYELLLQQLAARSRRCNVSLKLTALGLRLDEGACASNLLRIARRARDLDTMVRVDMEDHSCTDATLRIYHAVQPKVGNLGLVLQAMLYRTPEDITSLAPQRVNVRLCKGIYREPAALAHQKDEAIRTAFVECLRQLLQAECHVGIATHDDVLVERSLDLLDELGVPRAGYEFQTLLGVRPELRRRLIDAGHRLRVYIPYGDEWYAYSLRRLRENPKVARHILRAVLLRR